MKNVPDLVNAIKKARKGKQKNKFQFHKETAGKHAMRRAAAEGASCKAKPCPCRKPRLKNQTRSRSKQAQRARPRIDSGGTPPEALRPCFFYFVFSITVVAEKPPRPEQTFMVCEAVARLKTCCVKTRQRRHCAGGTPPRTV